MSISRQQLLTTPVYGLTHYRAQAQKVEYCVADIGLSPSGRLAFFNAYVALSYNRLLHDFDKRLLVRHPNEHLREGYICLQILDHATKMLPRSDKECV